MIITAFVSIIYLIFSGLYLVLPEFSVWPDGMIDAMSGLGSSLYSINFFVPVDVFFADLIWFMLFCTAIVGYIAIAKVMNYFRGADVL